MAAVSDLEWLRKREEFARIYRQGKSYRKEYIRLLVCRNGNLLVRRLGITIPKKVGTAVRRNRLRRRVREWARKEFDRTDIGWEAVVHFSGGASVSFGELSCCLRSLFERAGLLRCRREVDR